MKTHGFTLIEVLVVISIISVLIGLTTVLIGTGRRAGIRTECLHHVRELVGALETLDSARYPKLSGPNMLLLLVNKRVIGGKDGLRLLFCPGDPLESLDDAGGIAAYNSLDLKRKGEYGHLTSYAARDQSDPKKRARKGAVPAQVLVADDSGDHHEGLGIVVGLTGGTAKWRDRLDDYELPPDEEIVVGEGSSIEELVCLMRD